MKSSLDNLYKKIILFCKKKKAKWLLYFISFAESIIFPLPTDPFIIPFIIAENKFIKLAFFVTISSVAGGMVSYYIGNALWDFFYPILNVSYPNISNLIEDFENDFSKMGIILILICGFSPFPYKVTCIASGILGINFFTFILASLFSRGVRFFLVSFLIFRYGEKSVIIIKKNILIISLVLIILLICYLLIL